MRFSQAFVLLSLLLVPLAVGADPIEKSADGSGHSQVLAPVDDSTKAGWKIDTAADSRSQDAYLEVERDILNGSLKIDWGGRWGDNVKTSDDVDVKLAQQIAGATLSLDAKTDLARSEAGCNLKLDLSDPLTSRLSVEGAVTSTAELTANPLRTTSMGLGYKLGQDKDLQLGLLVDRDSDGLFELTSSLKEKFHKWGSIKLEAVRKIQQNSPTLYKAGYSFDLSDRFSLGAEADLKPMPNDTSDVEVKANLKVAW